MEKQANDSNGFLSLGNCSHFSFLKKGDGEREKSRTNLQPHYNFTCYSCENIIGSKLLFRGIFVDGKPHRAAFRKVSIYFIIYIYYKLIDDI